jgi:diguanylate cyclase (GGDEF)-like protein/PAS domain S-box-containing protein
MFANTGKDATSMLDFLPLVVTPPDSSLLYTGHYDPVLVGLSIFAAIFASYAALLVSEHVAAATAIRTRRLWIAVGGLCMGIGIWAMHFVGMLAFSLPCGSSYDPVITLVSMIPGVLASTLAITIVSRPSLTTSQLASGGLLLGAGIGAMHYSGMAAMRLDGLVRYDLKLFLVSILVAVALATLALWIKFRLRAWQPRWHNRAHIVSSVVMGSAVSGMHYTAMAAAYFIGDGDVGGVDSQVTPTFLASMVLAATGAIVVMTIAATYAAKPNLFSLGRSWKAAGLMIFGWVGIAWLSADYYYNRLADDVYRQESRLAEEQVAQVAGNIDENIQQLKGVAQVVSHNAESRRVLSRFGPDAAPSALAYEARERLWSEDARLAELNRYLDISSVFLKADALWVMNAAGDCIAASNHGKPVSFVGTNYADRDYFVQAHAGANGHQYAVGRKTRIPGLFYSAPVYENGRFVGAIAVKRDIDKFANLTDPAQAFISDANGIVVLAPNRALEHLALPDAAIAKLTPEERLAQYGRDRFDDLVIQRWGGDRLPGAVLIGAGDVPVVLASKVLPEDAITLHIARPLAELANIDSERNGLFILLSVAGAMLIVAAWMVVLYLRQSQKVDTDLRIAAAAFDVQEGMMITDNAGTILRVNQSFTEITGYAPAEAVGQTPQLLHSGRHDAAFYATMWQELVRVGGWQGEIWNRRKNGEVYPQWLSITAVKGGSGEITHYVGTMSDISHRKAAEDEIKNLAFYDTLTGLPNRRLLTDRLRQAMAIGARSGRGGALLFIDLDNFKTLNDTLGHDKGDLLLVRVAERLVGCMREGDTVARFGGDEFVVMLEGLSEHQDEAATQTRDVGEKILATLNQPYHLAGLMHHSTSSIGATLFAGHDESIDELLKQADLAMYQAKAAGRNVLRFFDQGMQAVVNARAAMEADLRQGVRRGEFILHYQVQVDRDGRLTGAEALVRWQHPQIGLVPPGEFIPLAEDTGLILPLGHWVLETACAQLLAWADQPRLAHLTLAVNLSARQFRHPDFVQQVLAVIEQTGVDPNKLKLEITESLLLHDVEDVIAKMVALQAHGVGFSLDDFGTGYSSLSYLKRLPLDQLKIDQSFVRDVLADPNDAAIARTIVALAKSLGLSVIAEGVETEAQRDFLASEGCHAYQGYLFGRPGPAADVEQLMSRERPEEA